MDDEPKNPQRLSLVTKQVLAILHRGNGELSVFTLFNRCGATVHELLEATRRLEELGLVNAQGSVLRLANVPEERHTEPSREIHGRLAKVQLPREFVAPQVAVGEPVVPWIPLLDETFSVAKSVANRGCVSDTDARSEE